LIDDNQVAGILFHILTLRVWFICSLITALRHGFMNISELKSIAQGKDLFHSMFEVYQ